MGNPDTANAYNHVFTLPFSMNSSTEDGGDISGAAFRRALQRRIDDLPDDELAHAVSPPDETTCTDAEGNTRHIRSMPIHSHLEMEAALCVWEFMEAASNHDHRLRIEALADLRDRIGSAELRHASIAIGRYCLRVYDLIPQEARQGHAYDWEIIPAIVSTIDFPSLEPKLPPAEAAARVIAQLQAPPPAPPARVEVPVLATQPQEHAAEPTVASEYDIRCPGCGSDEHMQVEIKTLADLSPDGTDPGPEHGWNEFSYIRCDACAWEGKVHQCAADAIAAARADAASTPTKRIMAEFVPQAWLNDHAIAVDPQGDTMFDVTDDILKLGREKALQLRDDQHETDHLRHAATAPQWVKDWSGPFVVNVEQAIESYFAEMDAAQQQTNESNAR
jgi:hypothetical protein